MTVGMKPCTLSDSNVVVLTRAARHPNRLTARDRIVALSWADQVWVHGYTKVVFDTANENAGHESGDFMLIYPRGEMWARWGIGCGPEGLTLWHAGSGTTLGTYSTMGETLAALPSAEAGD